jgi:hypothetical protein
MRSHMRTIATSDPRSAHSDYLLSNSGREAAVRLAALSGLFDDATVLHLKKCGVARGWHWRWRRIDRELAFTSRRPNGKRSGNGHRSPLSPVHEAS